MPNTKELQHLQNMVNMLPKSMVDQGLKRVWKKKTKILDNPHKHKNKIKKLQTDQSKKILFKKQTVFDWLEELGQYPETSKKQLDFIKWYKTKYPTISLKTLF